MADMGVRGIDDGVAWRSGRAGVGLTRVPAGWITRGPGLRHHVPEPALGPATMVAR